MSMPRRYADRRRVEGPCRAPIGRATLTPATDALTRNISRRTGRQRLREGITHEQRLVHHRRRPRHGHRHRPGRPRRRPLASSPPAATPPRSPTALGEHENLLDRRPRHHRPGRRRRRRSRPPSTGSAASTCSSTTPATSTPATSRRSAPSSSARRWRRTSSARSTSPARSCRSCASSAAARSSPSPPPPASSARSSSPPTPHRSSPSKAGWSRFATTSSRYGINTTCVEPGFFRTELLVEGASIDLARAGHRRLRRADRADHRGVEEHRTGLGKAATVAKLVPGASSGIGPKRRRTAAR